MTGVTGPLCPCSMYSTARARHSPYHSSRVEILPTIYTEDTTRSPASFKQYFPGLEITGIWHLGDKRLIFLIINKLYLSPLLEFVLSSSIMTQDRLLVFATTVSRACFTLRQNQ